MRFVLAGNSAVISLLLPGAERVALTVMCVYLYVNVCKCIRYYIMATITIEPCN